MEEDRAEEPRQSNALHGMHHWQITEVADIEKFYQTLEKSWGIDRSSTTIDTKQIYAQYVLSIEAEIYHIR